jgi:putative flavoprotein involved in K+ transport
MAPHSISADVTAWLGSFGAALTKGNLDTALSLFGECCFWRDMVAFTWNIKAAEGKEEIRAMLEATLPDAQPTDWQIEGEAMEVSGAINAFFKFETSVGRGRGHLRLMDGKCFTLLTTLHELKGFEEKVGATRPIGRGVSPEPNREPQGARMKEGAGRAGAQQAAIRGDCGGGS